MTYSHMGKPHTTIGAKTVSLLSSRWDQVVHARYGRQAILASVRITLLLRTNLF